MSIDLVEVEFGAGYEKSNSLNWKRQFFGKYVSSHDKWLIQYGN